MISFNQNLVQQISDKGFLDIKAIQIEILCQSKIFFNLIKLLNSTYDLVVGYKPQFASMNPKV